jgi:hypothetical protein
MLIQQGAIALPWTPLIGDYSPLVVVRFDNEMLDADDSNSFYHKQELFNLYWLLEYQTY